MNVIEADSETYAKIIGRNTPLYSRAGFASLHMNKCDQLKFLLFRTDAVDFGMVGGRTLDSFSCPVSAPFGGIWPVAKNVSGEKYFAAVKALNEYALASRLTRATITLPPEFYDPSSTSKLVSALLAEGFTIKHLDMNHHFDLGSFDQDYIAKMNIKARRNLKLALSNDFEFRHVTSEEGERLAYDVIRQNRESKSLPLKLSFDAIGESKKMVATDSFVVSKSGSPVAAAIAFRILPNIVHLIYWGDLLSYRQNHHMYFLAFEIFKFYHDLGFSYIDLGPCGESGRPNFNLARFKEAIGCEVSSKFTIEKVFSQKADRTISQ